MAIETPQELRSHLQWAVEVEFSTVPTYLYAMYAIEDERSEAYRLIRSVAVEEMLHLALAANLLIGVGGTPRLYDEDVVPSFPTPLPHHEPTLILDLEEPDSDVVEQVFLEIERPASVDTLPEDDDFETIGQFYLAIEDTLERLDAEYPLFEQTRDTVAEATNRAYQLTNPNYYRPVEYDAETSGGLHEVVDLASAERAVETIIHQGEGLRDHQYADPDHRELTHYYKFKRIADGEVPLGDTRPVLTNPKRADLRRSLRPVVDLFNACYSYVLLLLEDLFTTIDVDTEERFVDDLYTFMVGVMPPVARYLTGQPANAGTDRNAAPSFEFYRFDPDREPIDELRDLCTATIGDHPEISDIRSGIAALDD